MFRLVLADDHPVVLAGLAQLLGQEPDLQILAACASGREALAAVRARRPDVLVLDLQMPGEGGLDVLRALRAAGDPTRVVILTGALDEASLLEALRLEVRGVVLKDQAPRLLVACVRAVAAGGSWLESPESARALADLTRRERAAEAAARALTRRELEVVRRVAVGRRNKEIARELAITEGTVKIHLSRVYEKLGVDNRASLTRWAHTNGLL
jgi:two-component system, NarL family, nitrate/nitrite response regulator NarL